MHAREHEDRLAELLAGELERGAADPPAWLAECETCRARLESLRSVTDQIGRAGQTQRERLAELERQPLEPDEAEFPAALARLATAQPHARPRSRRALLVAAAAALLCLGVWIIDRYTDRKPVPVRLDGPGLLLVRPNGAVDNFEVFEWTFELEAGSFELSVEYEGEDGRQVRYKVEQWHERTWRPSVELRAKFGQRIYWTVTALDDQGGTFDSKSASAWLSSR